ncbi:hypothetical protein [Bacillus sp. FJAT-27225]|nr:hypothetical protein [Bacillus sp. FJAT-27225]
MEAQQNLVAALVMEIGEETHSVMMSKQGLAESKNKNFVNS